MTHRSLRCLLFELSLLMVVLLGCAPLSGLGQIYPKPDHLMCVKKICSAQELCCHKPADVPAPRSQSPSGHSSDCSCCISIYCPVVVAAIEKSDLSLIEYVIDIASMANQTPTHSRWRDTLLRPPIC